MKALTYAVLLALLAGPAHALTYPTASQNEFQCVPRLYTAGADMKVIAEKYRQSSNVAAYDATFDRAFEFIYRSYALKERASRLDGARSYAVMGQVLNVWLDPGVNQSVEETMAKAAPCLDLYEDMRANGDITAEDERIGLETAKKFLRKWP